jgi:hypothetical protein
MKTTEEVVKNVVQKLTTLGLPAGVVSSIEEHLRADLILPSLLPLKGKVDVCVEDDEVCVYAGPRDWQFNKVTGEFLSAGTFLE